MYEESEMGTNINQLVRNYLELLVRKNQSKSDLREFINLSGQGHSNGWKFDRDELHTRTHTLSASRGISISDQPFP